MIGNRARTVVGAVCLLLSGAGALFYELIWSHQFSVVFGSSEIATASVLGIYLAGLGFGAALAVRRCRRSRRPLVVYAWLEGTIAISALLVPLGLRGCQQLFHRSLATEGLPSASLGGSWLWQLAITAALLAVPTLCLGASFPYAVRGLVREDRGAGRTTAWLYSANTFGAVTGSLAVGIVVLPAVGIRASTWVGAALSLTAAALALALARQSTGAVTADDSSETTIDGRFPFAPVVMLAGAVSLASQILWTRLLIHFVGSGLYALSILLAAFLLGLALGSAGAGLLGSQPSRNAPGFAWAQLFVAGCSWVAFATLDSWVRAGQPAMAAFEDRLLRGVMIATATLLPMAAGSGAAFLFAINARARNADGAAPTVARAYQWTAVGNLGGGIFLALVVFPLLGFAGSQELLIALSLAAAAMAARVSPRRKLLVATIGVMALAVVLFPLPRAHGVLTFSPLTGSSDPAAIVFAELGTSASVVVTEQEGEWSLRTNGLGEGSIQPLGVSPSRYLVTRWLGLLPFLARPEAADVLVIGLGAGTTVEAIPRTVDRIAVIEIEKQVVEANRRLAAERRFDPLTDPRLELVINDARDVLHRTRQSFDVVVSQPSHPWTAGAANLYTREFFQAVASRLRPGGVLAQWLGLPFVDADLLRSVLATLADVFPHVEVYRPPPGQALIFLASDRPLELGLPEPLRQELTALGIFRSEDIAARWVLSTEGVHRAARDADLVTDDRNLLAIRSPRVLGRGLARSRGREVLAEHDPLIDDSDDLDRLALIQRLLDPERMMHIAEAEPDPARRQLLMSGLPGASTAAERDLLILNALEIDPGDEVLRAAALVAARPAIARGDSPPGALRDLAADEQLIVEGWRAAASNNWRHLTALDPQLSRLSPDSPLYWECLLLRAQWRAHSTDAADHRQALSLLDALLSHRLTSPALALYAITADRAGFSTGALAALSDLSRMPRSQRSPSADAAARALLRGRDLPPDLDVWVQEIEREPPH